MRSKLNILILILTCLVTIAWISVSCKKPNYFEIPCLPYIAKTHRIQEIIIVENGDTTKSLFYYDSLNRLRHQVDSGKSVIEYFYGYTNDKVLMLGQDSTSVHSYISLDSNGYAVRYSMGWYTWEINPEGYLLKRTESFPNAGSKKEVFSYFCFNNVTISTTGTIGPSNVPYGPFVTSKEYFEDQINTIGNENIGIAYLGKQDNCLVRKIIAQNQSNTPTVLIYLYEFDSLKRVKKEITKVADIIYRTRTFKYYSK